MKKVIILLCFIMQPMVFGSPSNAEGHMTDQRFDIDTVRSAGRSSSAAGFRSEQEKSFLAAHIKEKSSSLKQIRLSVEGTSWAGSDSDGDYYEYIFSLGGRLKYRTNSGRDRLVLFDDINDSWRQHDHYIQMNIGTSVYKGVIKADIMSGIAWNLQGRRWKWRAVNKE